MDIDDFFINIVEAVKKVPPKNVISNNQPKVNEKLEVTEKHEPAAKKVRVEKPLLLSSKSPSNTIRNTQPRRSARDSVAADLKSCDVNLVVSASVGSDISPLFSKDMFTEMPFDSKLIACLSQRLGITKVTAIQKLSIPALMSGKDCLIKAQTGSGKTLAYALPIVQMMQALQPEVHRDSGLLCVIITPTRELATQTFEVLTTLTQPFVRIVAGCLTGGVRMKAQKNSIRKGLNIIVTTPQRLLEHIRHTHSLDLSKLRWIVIDEADRVLEMGYAKDVSDILEQAKATNPNKIQNILLSATLTAEVEKLACLSLEEPARCIVNSHHIKKPVDDDVTVEEVDLPAGLKHFVLIVPVKLRLVALSSFLLSCQHRSPEGSKVIVFLSTQDSVNFHYSLLLRILQGRGFLPQNSTENIQFFRLHGKITHDDRQKTFHAFQECKKGVLFTTDVAARGLDISCVSWVVQYNPPTSAVDYIHRVGRTARAGGRGKAVILLNPNEHTFANHLQEKMSSAGLKIRQLHLSRLLKNTNDLRLSAIQSQAVEDMSVKLQRMYEDKVDEDADLKFQAEQAYVSVVRSYATFSREMREFFNFTELHLGHLSKSYALRETPTEVASKMKKQSKDNPDKRSSQSTHSKPFQKKVDHAQRNMLAEYGVW